MVPAAVASGREPIMDDHNAHGLGDFRPLRLRLQPGDNVVEVTKADILIGRQSDADLRMPQPDVSRQHCRLQLGNDGWLIVDLNSLNGVYINGARVRRSALLQPGDIIRICNMELCVEDPAAFADGPSEMLANDRRPTAEPTIARRVA
jgi:pSer/pThr/pTyr-binding forkhead associated (FHA) protein